MNQDDLESAMRRLRIDDAPRPEHVQMLRLKVLDAYDVAADRTSCNQILLQSERRRRIMFLTKRFGWTLLAAAAIVWLFLPGLLYSSSAFADVVQQILSAKTAKFQMSVKNEIQSQMTFRCFYKAPNFFRQESADAINITDFTAGKMVSLMSKEKQAMVMNLKNVPTDKPMENQFDLIRRVLRESRQKNETHSSLGEKEEGGRRIIGYSVHSSGVDLEVWGDVKTREPVHVSIVSNGLPKTEVTMSDFEFDMPLDDGLFNTTVPPGYRIMSTDVDVSKVEEKDLIASLKHCAESDGRFPDALNATTIGRIVASQIVKQKKEPTNEQMQELYQRSIKLGRGFSFALQLDAAADAYYAGRGVKLGTKDRPIFWYKPTGSAKYRVINADLEVTVMEKAPVLSNAVKLRTNSDK